MYTTDDSKLAIAQEYAAIGFQLLPIHTVDEVDGCSCDKGTDCGKNSGKHPLTENGVHDASNDPDTLVEYFSGDYEIVNIALATGEPSGVFVIDEDAEDALGTLATAYTPIPTTWTAKTGSGGRHYYFRYNPEKHRLLKNAVKFCGALDVRTTGGYAILPPSNHHTGGIYEWIVPPWDCPVADAPDWLLDLIPKHDDDTSPTVQERASESEASPLRGDADANVSPPTSPSTLTVQRARTTLERAALYLEKTPPAISGENGHKHTFFVFCKVCELFGELTDDELLQAAEAWNERCQPPWSPKELRHKLRDARKKTQNAPALSVGDSDEKTDMEWPVLHEDAYHGLAGEIVRTIEPQTEADPAGVLLTLLTCLGSAIGNRPAFFASGDRHHCNLFICLVGDTASGKGQAWGFVKHLMEQVDSEWAQDRIAYGLSSGEGLIERLKDPEVGEGILTVPPVQILLCYESEFAKPTTAMRREGNTLSAVFRMSWDGQTLEVMTRGSKLKASNAHVSMITHITPEELDKTLGSSIEVANGFANRFCWVLVRSTKDLPSGGDVSVIEPYVERLRSALKRASTITKMVRTAEAEDYWASIYPSLKYGQIKVTERARPQVLRLSMIYALVDGSETVEKRHIKAALAVWRYCEASARILFDSVGTTLANRLLQKVKKCPGIKRGDLRHSVSHSTPTADFDAALEWLSNRDEIVCVPVYENRQADTFYVGVGASVSGLPRGGNPFDATPTNGSVGHGTEDVGNGVSKLHPDSGAATENTDDGVGRRTQDVGSPPSPPEPASPTSYVPPQSQPITETTPSEVANLLAGQEPTSYVPTDTSTATLADLLTWKNGNGIRFTRREEGDIWVTPESVHVPHEMASAIRTHQDTLAVFVKAEADVPTVDETQELTEDEFYAEVTTGFSDEMKTFTKELLTMNNQTSP